jgi:hypothetical protein
LGPRVRLAAVVTLIACATSVAAAQEPFYERFNLDKLQLSSLGASYGRVFPSQVVPTSIFAVAADYGEIAPNWRVVFGVSYWESRFRDAIVQQFVDSLKHNLIDPSGQASIQPSHISLYDIAFSVEGRYIPKQSNDLKPFLGVGVAAHAVNAEGKLINGTFVERSLDNIGIGLFVNTGVSVKLLKHLGVEVSARGDLLSSFRSSQLRAGATYYFGHVRGMQPPPGSPPGPP